MLQAFVMGLAVYSTRSGSFCLAAIITRLCTGNYADMST